MDAGDRRDGGAVQHHDGLLGRAGGAVGRSRGHLLYPAQRYTKEFLDREEYFTLTFFDEKYRRALSLCGSKSGRDVDKIKECGFTVRTAACGAPYFEQARLVLVCRKRFVQEMDPGRIPQDVKEKWYPQQDYHTMYIGEITEAWCQA